MKKQQIRFKVFALLVCLACLVVFSGCETVRGMGRDIKKIDQWFKDNLW